MTNFTMRDQKPSVKFFTKNNGNSIAYAVHGQGPVLIVPAWWVSHIELDWSIDAYKDFFLKLGEYFTIVRYDRPGVGLSDRKRDDFSLEDEVATLSELITHLGFEEVSLLGVSCGGPPCIAYAQTQAERVKHIIFVDSYANGLTLSDEKIQHALCSLVSAHWGLGAKAILDLFDPDMDPGTRAQMSKIHKLSASAEMAASLLRLSFSMDAAEAAGRVSVPSLIIHHSQDKTVPFDAGRRLAALLPDSQFVSIAGKSHVPWLGASTNDVIKEILSFTGPTCADVAPNEHNQFRKNGAIWALSYAGRTTHIKDSRGLNDIALLIRHKRQDIHVNDMVRGGQAIPQESQSEVSDELSIREYQRRLLEISEEKALAAASADDSHYLALDNEEEHIIAALKQSVGLSGRLRRFNHTTEKARKAVAARIRSAIRKIEVASPDLAEHLDSAINTGNYCSYSPRNDTLWLT